MAYQFSALFIEGDHSDAPRELFEELGFPNAVGAGRVDFVEATNPPPQARTLAHHEGWTMLTDAGPFVSIRKTAPFNQIWSPQVTHVLRERTADGRRAFGFVFSSVSETYGFSLFEDGEHVRSRLEQMGQIRISRGDELPEEQETFARPNRETAILHLMEKLAIPFRAFENVRFDFFAFEREF